MAGPAAKQFCKRNLPISGTHNAQIVRPSLVFLRIQKQRDVESSNIPLKKHDACTQTDSQLELTNYKNFVIILYKLGKNSERFNQKARYSFLLRVFLT